jgi:uncharacterized protein (TIGR02246 family)
MIARVATTPRPAPGPGQPADELIGAIDGKPADTTTLLLIGGPGYRGGAGVTQTQGVGVQGDVEGRLRRLEDVIEIQQLFVSYGHCLDRGDFAAYAQLFAEDGEFMMGPVGRAHGREEIEAVMARTFGGGVGSLVHLITNPVINLDGDRATSDVMWTVVARGADGQPVLSMVGRHKDDLVREGGRWLFQRRRGLIEIPSSMPGATERP